MNLFKRSLLLGLLSGVLSGCVSLLYERMYTTSMGADFSRIVTVPAIFIASLAGSLLAALAYGLFHKILPRYGEIIFNFLLSTLTFASIIGPFAVKLPLDLNSPELLPGMVVPMHFFPAMAWFTLRPLIIGKAWIVPEK